MSDLISCLKSEITRLARKEVKAAVDPVHTSSGATRKAIADLKRRMEALEKELHRLNGMLSGTVSDQPRQVDPVRSEGKMRITSRNVRSLRNRLGLTPPAFAKLLGVSSKWVYLYENKEGPLKMRAATLSAFLAAKALTAAEAKSRVEGMVKGK